MYELSVSLLTLPVGVIGRICSVIVALPGHVLYYFLGLMHTVASIIKLLIKNTSAVNTVDLISKSKGPLRIFCLR